MCSKTYTKSEMTKKSLLDAITQLLQDQPYKSVTVRDICKQADLSSGAFYHHFSSKDELTKQAYLTLDEIVTVPFIEKCNALPPDEAIFYLMSEYISFMVSDKSAISLEYFKILLDGNEGIALSENRAFYGMIKEQLLRCQHEGHLSADLTFEQIFNYTLAFIRGLIFDWFIHGRKYHIEEQLDTIFILYKKAVFTL